MAKVRATDPTRTTSRRRIPARVPASSSTTVAPKAHADPQKPALFPFPDWAWMAALAAATLAVFGSVVGFSFTSWDDLMMVTMNPWFHPVRPESFTHFWRYPYYDFFTPLLYHYYALCAIISHALHPGQGDQLSPSVFHTGNLLLEIANVLLLFRLLVRMGAPSYGAFLGALLAALHPLVAEPVSWIASVDTLLTTFFCLLALWQYLIYAGVGSEPNNRWLHFAISTLFFFLAVLCKPTALCLPIMVVVLEVLLFRRSLRVFGPPLLLWFGAAFVWSFLARAVQLVSQSVADVPIWQRPFIAGDALSFYLMKLFWPYPQAAVYGRTPFFVLGHAWGYLTWLVPAAVALIAWRVYKSFPYLAVGFALMVAGTLPTLGLIPFQYQALSTVGDRYMYLPMIGPALVLAFFAARLRRPAIYAIAGVLLIAGIACHIQSGAWRRSETLYQHSLAINPNSPDIHDKMGDLYMQWKEPAKAAIEYRSAVELSASEGQLIYGGQLVYNEATAYALSGQIPEAEDAYRRAIALQPDYARSYFGLGLLYAQMGRLEDAVDEWRQGLAISPNDADYHYNMGLALLRLGRYEESAREFQTVLALRPGDAGAERQLARALLGEERALSPASSGHK